LIANFNAELRTAHAFDVKGARFQFLSCWRKLQLEMLRKRRPLAHDKLRPRGIATLLLIKNIYHNYISARFFQKRPLAIHDKLES